MRDKLIDAAIARFGKRGFDAVGTREIAAAVGTPMSSITYHFGGKEGLYLAAAEYIFDYLQTHVAPAADAVLPEGAPVGERIDAISIALRRIGTFMLSEESAPFALFIGREQQDPTPAVLELMRERMLPMTRAMAGQVALIRPELSAREAGAVTVYLFGMAITLRHSRASLHMLLDIDRIDAVTGEMLLAQLESAARAILGAGAR